MDNFILGQHQRADGGDGGRTGEHRFHLLEGSQQLRRPRYLRLLGNRWVAFVLGHQFGRFGKLPFVPSRFESRRRRFHHEVLDLVVRPPLDAP
eukprot:3932051-Rhodomonas_salina.1